MTYLIPTYDADHERLAEREGSTRESLAAPIAKWDGILMSDLGTPDQRVVSGELEELATVERGRMHCRVLPADFAGLERQAYERRRGQSLSRARR